MTIQHVDIPDADRHEPKGALSAAAGQALFALGSDVTEFRNIAFSDITGLPTFSLTLIPEITAYSITDQTISAANTEQQIVFGGATSSDNIDLDALGTVTFLTDGTYMLLIELAAVKTGGSSGTRLFFKETYDGVEVDKCSCIRFKGTETDAQKPVYFQTIIEATAGKVYKMYFAADTNNTCGFVSDTVPGALGWGHTDTHSTHLRVYSFGG